MRNEIPKEIMNTLRNMHVRFVNKTGMNIIKIKRNLKTSRIA